MEKLVNPLLAQDQLDMALLAEAELARLKRQYRIMEGDRKAFLDDTTNKLAKQRKIIARLHQEKAALLEDIKVASCAAQKRKDLKIGGIFEKLLQKYSETEERVDLERKRLGEIDEQIVKTEKLVVSLRLKREIPESEYRERIKSGQLSIKSLQNKLETVVRRFCTMLTENKKMREEIDHLLKERTRFNCVWEKLLLDLNSGKTQMLDLIEQATVAYDQREEWCSKLQALKVRAHNDVIAHAQEMREMHRQLDHDGNLREFLTVKGQKRVMKDLEEKENRKKELEKEAAEKQIKLYQETLGKIRDFCGESDVERIAAKFLKQEEENFALFNYVNELNHELEGLGESIGDLGVKIGEIKEENAEREKEQKDTIDCLERSLEEIGEKAKIDVENARKEKEDLDLVLGEIERVFNCLNCGSTPILGLLGETPMINESNAFVYLGLLEKKIMELITSVYYKEKSLMKKRMKQ